jgi:hypothetical protein
MALIVPPFVETTVGQFKNGNGKNVPTLYKFYKQRFVVGRVWKQEKIHLVEKPRIVNTIAVVVQKGVQFGKQKRVALFHIHFAQHNAVFGAVVAMQIYFTQHHKIGFLGNGNKRKAEKNETDKAKNFQQCCFL